MKAILDAQLAMEKTDWSAVGGLRFRAGIHTGAAESRNNDWYGPAMNRVGRLDTLRGMAGRSSFPRKLPC